MAGASGARVNANLILRRNCAKFGQISRAFENAGVCAYFSKARFAAFPALPAFQAF
jgi:hypothetical protein